MKHVFMKKFWKRGAALLLALLLLPVALPEHAEAAGHIEVYSLEGGVASHAKGDGYNQVTATPSAGYVFDYWEVRSDNGGYTGTFYGNPLTVPNPANGWSGFHAHFRRVSNPHFGVGVQVGSLQANHGTVSGSKLATDDRTDVTTTITATPTWGYEFMYWATNEDPQKVFYSRSMQVTAPAGQRIIYTAYFGLVSTEAYGVFTRVKLVDKNGNLIPGVVPGGAVGDMAYSHDGVAQQTALHAFPASDKFVFSHWELKRGNSSTTTPTVVSSANPYTVRVDAFHDEYTAVFRYVGEASGVTTAVKLVDENGTKILGETPGTATGDRLYDKAVGAGQQTTLQAFPKSEQYTFSHWEWTRDDVGEGQVSNTNPYSVPVEDHRDVYTAVFKRATDAYGVTTAVKLVDASGTEIPGETPGSATGARRYDPGAGAGQQTALQAFPASNQYVFSHWELTRDGAAGAPKPFSSGNPITVEVVEHHDTYTAVFIRTPDNGEVAITPETTDYSWIKSYGRKFTDPVYGTTRESLEALAKETVNKISARYENADPSAGGSAAVTQLQEQLAMRALQRIKDRSEMAALQKDTLVSSDNEPFATVPVSTVGYEDFADETVQKRFGQLYDYSILQAVRVTGPGGGADGTESERTLVWKYTGAIYGDRLLLLQFLPDGMQRAVTPIADEDGTLTFPIVSAAGSEFMLLRVFIKQ